MLLNPMPMQHLETRGAGLSPCCQQSLERFNIMAGLSRRTGSAVQAAVACRHECLLQSAPEWASRGPLQGVGSWMTGKPSLPGI